MTQFNDVQSFRTQFSASRSNRYGIDFILPGYAGSLDQGAFRIFAKATSVPGSIVNFIPVGHQGRIIKFGGERQFGEWVIQVYDAYSGKYNIRKVFEEWINKANDRRTNTHQFDIGTGVNWTVNWDDITHTLSAGAGTGPGGQSMGSPSSSYTKKLRLYNCWPSDISPIDLSYDQADAFSEFTVTMNYDYHLYI
jgi:hypothetical protein